MTKDPIEGSIRNSVYLTWSMRFSETFSCRSRGGHCGQRITGGNQFPNGTSTLLDVANGQEERLCGGLRGRECPLDLWRYLQRSVKRVNGVGGLDYLLYGCVEGMELDRLGLCPMPSRGDRGILPASHFSSKVSSLRDTSLTVMAS